ncbi:hypothetical protein HNO88_000286 [Novosphingobium chloroacetimidivorans]|uniref:Uncharacterized protein n=1 Tax=Novosphingobium chloroacetimidivorans TaxID=1428314 RepID=A0A7W7K768_9SPHN|nr:hypothetical protein [Novosphingobium chloroacetimidivorans]
MRTPEPATDGQLIARRYFINLRKPVPPAQHGHGSSEKGV